MVHHVIVDAVFQIGRLVRQPEYPFLVRFVFREKELVGSLTKQVVVAEFWMRGADYRTG